MRRRHRLLDSGALCALIFCSWSCSGPREEVRKNVSIRTDFKSEAVGQFMAKHGGETVTFTGALATAIWFGIISGGKSSGPSYPLFNQISVRAENLTDKTVGFDQEVTYGEHDYSLSVAEGTYELQLTFLGRYGKFIKKMDKPLIIGHADVEVAFRLVNDDLIEMSLDGIPYRINPGPEVKP
jgi:hypothetical protein